MKRLSLIIVAIGLAVGAGCDGGIHVEGNVRDPLGRPVQGADVVLDRSASARSFHDKSDAQGHFSTGGIVAPGKYEYTLHVRAKGFKEATAQLQTIERNRVTVVLHESGSPFRSGAKVVSRENSASSPSHHPAN